MVATRTRRRPQAPAPSLDLNTAPQEVKVRATLVNGLTYSVRDFDNAEDPIAMITFRRNEPRDISLRLARHLEKSATDLVDSFVAEDEDGSFRVSQPVQKFRFEPVIAEPTAPDEAAEEAAETA